MDINTLNDGLAKAKKNGTVTFKAIAKAIYKIIQLKKKIKNVTEIIKIAYVSYASVTKFIKYINLDNAKILIALINESISLEKIDHYKQTNKIVSDVANEIEKARKVLFIGASSNYYVNSNFATKLMRLDKWVAIVPHKYEQIGLSKLQTHNDLMIVTSPSLQHKWIRDIIEKTNCKTILLTGSDYKNADFIFRATKKERNDGLRFYTVDTGIQFEGFFGDIFKELIKKDNNHLLLKMTRYIS